MSSVRRLTASIHSLNMEEDGEEDYDGTEGGGGDYDTDEYHSGRSSVFRTWRTGIHFGLWKDFF